ncbi:uncharacterized protein N7482_000179 [Penicillium canariense]|uniref:Uncharacterized protein n=1 Tax=Penicillium canariense TaxID=189055 RepID=A0A9W9LSW7_9EURO|nr:uncharacterized protein N7482_000179 [Penicillium canariense]KAJ5174302.1 hypothetical protein N7482_000179 [Penicillium canariense]
MSPKRSKSGTKPFHLAPYIFGIQTVPLLASGVYSLLFPAAAAGLPDSPLQGTFYAIASYQNNVPMMIAAVPGRLLAMFVFHRSGGGWKTVAPFEGFMSLLTALGLWWDWHTASLTDEKPK